jgi:hypothetical protein
MTSAHRPQLVQSCFELSSPSPSGPASALSVVRAAGLRRLTKSDHATGGKTLARILALTGGRSSGRPKLVARMRNPRPSRLLAADRFPAADDTVLGLRKPPSASCPQAVGHAGDETVTLPSLHLVRMGMSVGAFACSVVVRQFHGALIGAALRSRRKIAATAA